LVLIFLDSAEHSFWFLHCQLAHVVSFYFFLAGFVYASEARAGQRMIRLAWTAFGAYLAPPPFPHALLLFAACNMLAFGLRVGFELAFIDFRPMRFA
jgi:hypothetical protein